MATEYLSTFLKQLIRGMAAETLGDQTDRQLVEQFLARREEAAFETIVRRHGAMVYRVCWRVLRQSQDTEDAFQATFLLLAQKLRSVRKHDSIASWLHGVAHRVALQAKGRAAGRRRHEPRASLPQVERAADLSAEELLVVLDAELGKLPDKWRLPLILCYLEGRTQEESARQLGWSMSTLRRRLEEARHALGRRLMGRGVVGSAALGAVLLSDCIASASPPLGLVTATIEAAASVAAGKTVATAASANVVALSEGMVNAMFMTKIKIATGVLLAALVIAAGASLITGQMLGAQPGPSKQPAVVDRSAEKKPGEDSPKPILSLQGHKDRLTSVAYSPDGRWIATASLDGTARLWDAQTGKEVRRLDVPPPQDRNPAQLSRILFSADSELVVVAQQAGANEVGGVIVWKRQTGEKLHEFPGGPGSVAIAPDGSLIACGGSGVIRLYGLATGKLVHEMRGQQDNISSLTFSPDGKTLVSTGPLPRPPSEGGPARLGFMPAVIRVWDVSSGKESPSTMKGLRVAGFGRCIAFSPDGRTLAVDTSLWEIATGGPRIRFTGHTGLVGAVAFSPDGLTLASGSDDGTLRLWDVLSGKELGRFGKTVDPSKGGWVLAVAFSPDGRTLVSGGLDIAKGGQIPSTADIWDVSRITWRPRTLADRSPAELEADWNDLAGDAQAAYAALRRLILSPEHGVPFIEKQLQNATPADNKRIEQLIKDLDANQYSVREQATKELGALGDRVMPALKKALAGALSAEAGMRLRALLDRIASANPSAETIREIRAVAALESIGSPQARRLLGKLASGPTEMRLTAEAKAAAGRLAK